MNRIAGGNLSRTMFAGLKRAFGAGALAVLASMPWPFAHGAYSAETGDAESAMLRSVRNAVPRNEAIRDALAEAVCGDAQPGPTTIGLILAAQDAGIVDLEIGAGLGAAAVLAADCNAAASEAIARIVGDMGTLGLRNAFVAELQAEGGHATLVTIATTDPTVAFRGVDGYLYNYDIPVQPCDRPGCN